MKSAGGDRKEAFEQTSFAAALLTKQHDEDKSFIREQDERIRSLEKSRFKFALIAPVVSFGAGYGTCALQSAFPNGFGR